MSQQITFDWQTGEDVYAHRLARHFGAVAEPAYAHVSPVAHPAYETVPYPAASYPGSSQTFFDDAPIADTAVRDGERVIALFALRSLAALVFVLLAAGGAPMSPDQNDRLRVEQELSVVLELDDEAWRTRDREAHAALLDQDVGRAWAREWREGWGASVANRRAHATTLGHAQRIGDDLVRAQVYVSTPRTNWWQAEDFRETRFYRETDGMWLRTTPPDSFWGEPLTLRTEHFVYHYYAPDAASIEAIAPMLDEAYAGLYRALGQDVPSTDRVVQVRVQPGPSRYLRSTDRVLDVTSPILAQIPTGTSDADYLAERIFSRVTGETLRSVSSYGSSHRWAFVFSAARNWLVDDLLGMRSHWMDEARAVFRADLVRAGTAGVRTLELSDLDDYYVGGTPGRDTVLWRYAAVDSLLDYVYEREGSDALAELVEELSRTGLWTPLIETVTGVSVEEFTAGWNAYLAAEYGSAADYDTSASELMMPSASEAATP